MAPNSAYRADVANRSEIIEILLLEDDDRDAELLSARLELDGVHASIIRAYDRASFLDALRNGAPDVILSDYNLPGYDGGAALEHARETAPGVPFLFVSGAMGEEIAIESLKRGATDYVLKHRLERLGPAVRRALRERANYLERLRIEKERDALLEAETHARLEAERASSAHRFLGDASKALASTLDLSEALGRVMRFLVPSFADWAAIDLTGENGEMVRIACAHRDSTRESKLASFWLRERAHDDDALRIQEVAQAGETHLVQSNDPLGRWPRAADDSSDLQTARLREARDGECREFGAPAWVVVPIRVRARLLGILVVSSREGSTFIPDQDVSLAEELARRIAMAVDNAHLYDVAQIERRRAEEANRSKDEFLAALSHELRTPLNAICGWAKMLRSGLLGQEKHARALEVIERNAQIQAQLIDDLLDVSRIVSGKLRLSLSSIDLRDVVEMAVEGVRPQAEAKQIKLHAQLSPEPANVHGDTDRLQQVVWNLVTNAVKFTPAQGHIDIGVFAVDGGAEVMVRDSGQGISADFLPYVFERFRQSESGATRAHGGLGLGLTIVRRIVELHHGRVEATSEGEGKGATFIVRLPASPNKNATRNVTAITRQPLPHALDEIPHLHGIRVLVVDDEKDARDLLVNLFQHLNASVVTASSAAEAMRAMLTEPPHVLVSDIGMPGEDGFSLMRRIRALSVDQGGGLPAIALTAFAAPEDRVRALDAGFDRHLSKPVEPARLASTIAELIESCAR
jgi:signal transduction histidine kinase/DNA-binding response OmpR family regulator